MSMYIYTRSIITIVIRETTSSDIHTVCGCFFNYGHFWPRGLLT